MRNETIVANLKKRYIHHTNAIRAYVECHGSAQLFETKKKNHNKFTHSRTVVIIGNEQKFRLVDCGDETHSDRTHSSEENIFVLLIIHSIAEKLKKIKEIPDKYIYKKKFEKRKFCVQFSLRSKLNRFTK